jgi:hypothetical protein
METKGRRVERWKDKRHIYGRSIFGPGETSIDRYQENINDNVWSDTNNLDWCVIYTTVFEYKNQVIFNMTVGDGGPRWHIDTHFWYSK